MGEGLEVVVESDIDTFLLSCHELERLNVLAERNRTYKGLYGLQLLAENYWLN